MVENLAVLLEGVRVALLKAGEVALKLVVAGDAKLVSSL